MRNEWWLKRRNDGVWLVEGYNPDQTIWARLASDVEVTLWHRWQEAEERIRSVVERLEKVA